MTHNELGYTTLSVAESRRDVSFGATSCVARSVTEDNVPLGRARAKVPSGACQPQLCVVFLISYSRYLVMINYINHFFQSFYFRKIRLNNISC